ncbi:hypothetical protein BH09VER1_BH09VER1_07610 [soil metagenome]
MPGTADQVMAQQHKVFTVGTLTYTSGGMVTLFAWLLWGDFIFTFMEAVLPSLLPLLLKDHGASDTEIAVIVSTIYMIMNALLCPIISYRSDRFRSRWGRRRPFIFVSTPFVVLFLAAIPFAPDILRALTSIKFLATLLSSTPIAPVVLTFGFLVACFQVFHMFVASVYYYLIPDVVPEDYLGRFYALFRVFGTLAGVFFNYSVFGLAETHMREIFVGSALAYGIFIYVVCWRVKEGRYPRVPEDERTHWWDSVKTYASECFGYTYYWWVFLAYSAWTWAVAGNVFAVFFYQKVIGLNLDEIGKINAWSGGIFLVLAYPFGVMVDRWGSHRCLILGMGAMAGSSLGMFLLASDLSSAFLWSILRNAAVMFSAMVLLKWTVDVYPRERYGQFGSAGALFSSIGGIFLGPACGWAMQWIKDYRYFLLWNTLFAVVGFVAAMVVYRRWRHFGGPTEYRAP